jgi:hypothetical protein
VHVLASVLIAWVRNPPSGPLIPPQAYRHFEALAGPDSAPALDVEPCVATLPQPGQALLRRLVELLQRVDSDASKMNTTNLAQMFAPALINRTNRTLSATASGWHSRADLKARVEGDRQVIAALIQVCGALLPLITNLDDDHRLLRPRQALHTDGGDPSWRRPPPSLPSWTTDPHAAGGYERMARQYAKEANFAAAKAAVRNGLLADPGRPSLLRLQATLNDIDPHDASPKRQELPPPASRTNVPNQQDSTVTS